MNFLTNVDISEAFPHLGCYAAEVGSYRRFGKTIWDIRQQRLVVTDVSGQTMDPIFKGQGAIIRRLLDI